MYKNLLVPFAFLAVAAHAQEVKPLSISGVQFQAIGLSDYLAQIQTSSGTIKSKRLAVESAIANEPMQSSPNVNPSFSFSRGAYYGKTPYTPFVSPSSNTYSLSGTLEGWGKRQSRQNLAHAEIGRTRSEADAIQRAVEGDAIFAYFDTLRLKLNWLTLQKAIDRLAKSTDSNAATSIVEHEKIQGNIANDLKYFAYGMTVFLSKETQQLPEPIGNLSYATKEFDPKELVANAVAQRKDIQAMEAVLKTAQASVEVAKKNRNIDFSLSAWYSVTPAYTASGTSYDQTTAHGFSISMPIPTANLYDGPLVEALNNQSMADLSLRDQKLRVVAEVNQAYLQYVSARKKLNDAERVFQQSNPDVATSVEAIVAARETEVDLNDAKTNHAKALVFLRRVSGNYDLP